MKLHASYLLLAVVVLHRGLAHGESEMNQTVDLSRVSFPQGDAIVNRVVNDYHQLGSSLISQLASDRLSPDQKTYAIYLLGELRIERAAPTLVDLIDFKAQHVDPKSRIGRWGPYPAEEALIKIGRASVAEVLAKAQRPQSAERLQRMTDVLIGYYGAKLAGVAVDDLIAKSPEPDAKANLRKLRDAMAQRVSTRSGRE